MTEPVVAAPLAPPAAAAATTVRRRWPWLAALGLLVFVVGLELVAALALRPPPRAHPIADVMAVPGVAAMVSGSQIDPTELAQVASVPAAHSPLALMAGAVLDGLVLMCLVGASLSPLRSGRDVARQARLASFLASLAILLAGVVVVVGAISRLRFLVAIYLSPPFGTLTYLLRYGTVHRSAFFVVLAIVMAGKALACIALVRIGPRPGAGRSAPGLAVTSLAATVLTVACYSWAPPTQVAITDALAAAVVGLAAVGWAGVVVSGSVRRLS